MVQEGEGDIIFERSVPHSPSSIFIAVCPPDRQGAAQEQAHSWERDIANVCSPPRQVPAPPAIMESAVIAMTDAQDAMGQPFWTLAPPPT